MRLGWVGCHQEGIPALTGLVEAGAAPVAVLTLRPDLAANRSGAVDYAPLCTRLGLPLHHVASINDEATVQLLRGLRLDVLFVIGWSQILRAPALGAARLGTVGTHASLLPKNRGSAPVNWALIRGEPVTGNSLIWLAEDVDAGDLIDQTEFPITPYDTCASLYERVAASNREMILRALPRLAAGERPGTPQRRNGEPVLPRRRPQDGRIDWTATSAQVYDFVRALTRPYPGAFSWLDGQRWTVWRVARLPAAASARATPGAILGPVISPDEAACGQVVACGDGAVVILELEAADGTLLRGPRLAEQDWAGRVWQHD
ncbi:MAG TPA: methionyl-tRNA formyltransferase [Gemmatimonadales bacterium]|jgi:methionyl-tRNA formyltransferase